MPFQSATAELVAVGIACSRCGSTRSFVTHTRPLATGRIRRYRRCLACDSKFTTLEVRLRDLASMHRSGKG
jgi:transcriptional regulator NrdR family protein